MFKVAEREIEITAIAFDPTKRRLITGTRDGTVKLWNFHNGACLRQLQGADDNEVVCDKIHFLIYGLCFNDHKRSAAIKHKIKLLFAGFF